MSGTKHRLRWVARCIVGMALVTPACLSAAQVPWRDGMVAYTAKGKPLGQVLKDILATQPFPVVVQPDVRGNVYGEFNKSARSIFSELEAAYGLTWYYDGSTMYVGSSSDNRSEVIAIAPMSGAQAMRALGDLELIEPRFPVKFSGGSVLVSGPSRYVDLVAKALDSERERVALGLSQRNMSMIGALARPPASGGSSNSVMEIRVFPLHYAQAQDSERRVRGDRTDLYTVPGVATLLRNLLQGAYATPKKDPASVLDTAAIVQALAPLGDSSSPDGDAGLRIQALLALLARQQPQGNPAEGSIDRSVHIQADVRTNSVVIFDTPAMMPIYAQLIEQLDRPQRLVQLDVAIIDLDSGDARDLGVDLSLRGDNGEIVTGGNGLTYQALVGNSLRELRARVALLQTKGKARILSRPKVMTLDNEEAFMGSEQSLYVRTTGDRYANLVPVSTGLSFRATPLVMPVEGRPPKVKLTLEIVDGNFLNTSVDNVPGSSRKYLATQAVVEDGQSLLVGGFQFENNNDDMSGVPGLSNVPGVGALFRRTRKSHVQMERLYLITPRVVNENLNDTPVLATFVPPAKAPATQGVNKPPTNNARAETGSYQSAGFMNVWFTPTRSIDTQPPEVLPVKPLPPIPHRDDTDAKTESAAGTAQKNQTATPKTKDAPKKKPAPKSNSDIKTIMDKTGGR
ncbi:type III secretion system outer membrane ring subunit SctC [Dyella nitratireducens]|uniref:Type 3 secretion system secretin n=1 Tax=Dyella nitratireducens TaxID=1849580 RepID=A0ABQ1FNJ4_9GAMM|nr:type III secretion system outer membrane ring subunit SctC [Dyella nitratireducens]GGA23534.1 EscC/YscC/HrcC family type III secretion system outer membrane ring protein [Dyella nitratireducens]GLQ43956.1 EscC/YscC/HrcC family type III secretion system outer membrane ring protein [Dyella nitratireducens]